MRLTANSKLGVCGRRYPNEGPCVEVSLWDERTDGNPMQSAIFARQKEIASSNGGALQEYHARGYYAGDSHYYFPHTFWSEYPEIVKELEAAMNRAVTEVMAPIRVMELQQENERLRVELEAAREAPTLRIWFPIKDCRQIAAVMKKVEEVA
jgi:hypothetical protein